MNPEQEQPWITGEEIGRENRRLIEAGIPDEAPEFQELFARVAARDNEMYERYGKRYLDTHRGKWIAISLDGQVRSEDGKLFERHGLEQLASITWGISCAWGDVLAGDIDSVSKHVKLEGTARGIMLPVCPDSPRAKRLPG
jgi:hypothetical protein